MIVSSTSSEIGVGVLTNDLQLLTKTGFEGIPCPRAHRVYPTSSSQESSKKHQEYYETKQKEKESSQGGKGSFV